MKYVWVVKTNYDCFKLYFSTKEKAIKFIIDDNITQPGRTDSVATKETLDEGWGK